MRNTLIHMLHRLKWTLTSQKHVMVFTKIYRKRSWGGGSSVSGPGSENSQTDQITQKLPILLQTLGTKTLLDLPCGDFHWMQHVKLNGIRYTGGDVVEELIQRNQLLYSSLDHQFQKINLMQDHLQAYDVIFCRDCLVHFSNADLKIAIENIKRSHSKYFITTTFPEHKNNKDITTGEWRPINLMTPPFLFPEPLEIIVEGCTENNGIYKDKSLGVWRVADLPTYDSL